MSERFDLPARSPLAARQWRDTTVAGLFLVFVLTSGLLQGQLSQRRVFLGLAGAWFMFALFSLWRASRKVAVA